MAKADMPWTHPARDAFLRVSIRIHPPLRGIALGRKSRLFADSDRRGECMAVMYNADPDRAAQRRRPAGLARQRARRINDHNFQKLDQPETGRRLPPSSPPEELAFGLSSAYSLSAVFTVRMPRV